MSFIGVERMEGEAKAHFIAGQDGDGVRREGEAKKSTIGFGPRKQKCRRVDTSFSTSVRIESFYPK